MGDPWADEGFGADEDLLGTESVEAELEDELELDLGELDEPEDDELDDDELDE